MVTEIRLTEQAEIEKKVLDHLEIGSKTTFETLMEILVERNIGQDIEDFDGLVLEVLEKLKEKEIVNMDQFGIEKKY